MYFPKVCEDCSKKVDEEFEKIQPYAMLYSAFLELLCKLCRDETNASKALDKQQKWLDPKPFDIQAFKDKNEH